MGNTIPETMKRLLRILSAVGIVLCVAWLLYWSVTHCHYIAYVIAGIVILCLMYMYSNLD